MESSSFAHTESVRLDFPGAYQALRDGARMAWASLINYLKHKVSG